MNLFHSLVNRATRTALMASVLLAGISMTGAAQAQIAAEIEGPVSAVTNHGNGSASMTVMNIPVTLDANTVINTPTAALSVDQLTDSASLPGRNEAGFIGGTAIVVGNSQNGVIHAITVTIEPAENTVIGEITDNIDPAGCAGGMLPADGAIAINGVPMTFLTDPRIPFGEATNEGGFPINPCSLAAGDAAAVNGYFANDNLYVFAMTSDDADTAGQISQTAVTRVQCRERSGRLDVKGATTATSGNVTVIDETTGQVLGSSTVTADISGGLYRVRVNVPSCPQIVRATHEDGSFGVAEAQIR
jgi:hypothetical protein